MKYRNTPDSKPIPVLLDEALLKRIKAMSERLGEAKSVVMRISMRLGLESLENAIAADPQKTLSSLTSLLSRQGQGAAQDQTKPKKKAG